MGLDKRRAPRKPLRHSGWVASRAGEVLRECTLSDVSETGARLDIQNAQDLPDEFTLLLTRNAATRRECRVIWRSGAQVGVHFARQRR